LGMLTREDVNNLANLARIALSEEEKDKLQKDMESILGYVSELQKAPTSAEGSGVAKPENYYLRNVIREDDGAFEGGLNTETILSQAPKRKGDYLVTKKILGDSIS
jgi:aspartyl-tRNA(Asn)/glutamyl-tRNA(Gln) amidotransferase subunit C